MQPRSRLLMLACLALLALGGGVIAAQPPTKEQVTALLRGNDFDGYQDLIEMGGKAFPIYEAILSDPKADFHEVGRVLLIIGDVKADRHRFLKHAVAHLTNAKLGVRLNAVTLLKDIGSPREASPVVALLSDEDTVIVYAAARTLATIGGPREVVAMDVWLRGITYRDNAKLRQHVQKCRDKLKMRLDEVRAKDPSK